MAENKFKKSLETQKTKAEIEEGQSTTEEPVAVEEETTDRVKEIFGEEGNKPKTSNAHSLYLNDTTWKKLQRISKKQGISVSAVAQKIFDSVLEQ